MENSLAKTSNNKKATVLFNLAQTHFSNGQISEATKYLKMAADEGLAMAQSIYGKLLQDGEGVEKNDVEAFRYFKLGADQGDCECLVQVGFAYKSGRGVFQSLIKMLEYFKMAADLDDTIAQAEIAYSFYHGHGCPVNHEEAVRYYRLAAEKNDPDSQNGLGFCYKFGHGVPRNDSEALKWFKLAADQGYTNAQLNVAACYQNGEGASTNIRESAKYVQMASSKDNPQAKFLLGRKMIRGDGVIKNVQLGISHIQTAANAGCIEAQLLFAKFCHFGDQQGIVQNNVEAIKYYVMAADQGNVEAQYMCGYIYRGNGKPVPVDFEKAVKYFTAGANGIVHPLCMHWVYVTNLEKIAANSNYAESEYSLGLLYENGLGVSQKFKKAFKYYKLAADQGQPNAQHNLGTCYLKGKGVVENKAEARKYFKLAANSGVLEAKFLYITVCEKEDFAEADKLLKAAADEGNMEAQFRYAAHYYKPEISHNVVAIKYFQMAANQRNRAGQFKLAECYENGVGVKINLEKAFQYYKLSADQGLLAAQCQVVGLLEKGIGCVKNLAERFGYLNLIVNFDPSTSKAEKTDRFCETGEVNVIHQSCQHSLGICYILGKGTVKDVHKAIHYFRLAALSGTLNSQIELGMLYLSGEEVPKDFSEAAKWSKMASDQGDSISQYNLGVLYLHGNGIEKNDYEAFRLFALSAQQGHYPAQINLAASYMNGFGVERDFIKALKYYKLASEQDESGLCYFYAGICCEEENALSGASTLEEALEFFKIAAQRGRAIALKKYNALAKRLGKTNFKAFEEPKKKEIRVLTDPTEIQDKYECCLSLGIMTDPVICMDGRNYERSFIEDWLVSNNTSPWTRQLLVSKELIPNDDLREEIELYLQQQQNGEPSENVQQAWIPKIGDVIQTVNVQAEGGKYNNRRGKIVSDLNERGRYGVELVLDDGTRKSFGLKQENISKVK